MSNTGSTSGPRIIALGHQKNVGKDTCAQYIQRVLIAEIPRVKVVRYGFADKLKDVAHQLYGAFGVKDRVYYDNHRDEYNTLIPELNMTVRELWISLGNKLREIYPNTWVDYVLKNEAFDKFDFVIVPDLRYPNEFDGLVARGATTIEILRPDQEEPTDIADTALNGEYRWTHTISNDAGLAELYKAVEYLVKHAILGGDYD